MTSVLKISEAASLALHTMALLARRGQTLSAQEIAAALDASQAHLAKVMHRLAQAGLVTATRGPGGGFALGREAADVTLLEVYEAIEGPIRQCDCLYSTAICGGKRCIFGGMLGKVTHQVRQYLARTRLTQAAALLKDSPAGQPAGAGSQTDSR